MKQVIIMVLLMVACQHYLNTWTKAIVAFVGILAFSFWAYASLIGSVADAVLFTFCIAIVVFLLFGTGFCFLWIRQR